MTVGLQANCRAVLLVAMMSAAATAAPTRTSDQSWRDAGVAAFDMVWRTIHETWFDPTFGGLDWNAARAELRPRVENARSIDEQRAIIRDLLGRLGQSHLALLSATPGPDTWRGPATLPFDVRLADAGLLVTRLHGTTDVAVRPGDTILRIDGREVTAIAGAIDDADPRRAELTWRQVMRALSGNPGDPVRLDVRSPGGIERQVEATRVLQPGELVTVGNLPTLRAHLETAEVPTSRGGRVGIIRFNVWMAAVAQPFAEALDRFRDADGLIIDLRGNPGGLADMTRGVAGHLIDEPLVLGRMRMRDLDLEFRVNPRRSTADGRSVVPYAGPVAILVDELTASASECFAGGMQGLGRVQVFGTRSAGQALPASTRRLPNGDVLLYAVGDFVTATGERLEGHGVAPDVEVPLTPRSLAAGHDAEHAALVWIDGLPARRP